MTPLEQLNHAVKNQRRKQISNIISLVHYSEDSVLVQVGTTLNHQL